MQLKRWFKFENINRQTDLSCKGENETTLVFIVALKNKKPPAELLPEAFYKHESNYSPWLVVLESASMQKMRAVLATGGTAWQITAFW